VGQLSGADGFELPSLFCKWRLEAGSNFRLLEGVTAGQTQCDTPNEGEAAVWAHPLDVHYAIRGIDGWPRMLIEVYGVDIYGRTELAGYGQCTIPTIVGSHTITVSTWRPYGTLREQISTFFLGGTPRLKHTEIVTSPADRFRLHTQPSGEVQLQLGVLCKDFSRYGVHC